MNFEQALACIVAGNTIITFGTALYNLLSTRATKALQSIEKLNAKVDGLTGQAEFRKMVERFEEDLEVRARHRENAETRFQLVETRMTMVERELSHLPSKDSVTEVKMEIGKLNGDVGKLYVELKGIGRQVHMLDEYLRQREK